LSLVRLPLYVAAGSQAQKCGLKYVMYIPTKEIGEFTY